MTPNNAYVQAITSGRVPRLPYMHRNPRSRRIPTSEIREVFAEEVTRSLDRRVDRSEYLRRVMP
ncbi:hypothetical protein CH25_gp49 [Mycobacterium phage EagleEye]|uniref:Uncharacterized protein n=1 Tax=Mycobacterium phage EagleEye TaxID=1429759 RepID=W0LN18_9CAUD|nr:hypothetical protein CH25_gp49 [Mycobacterium phage EagleEye]AHG23837.1 hypothetical protein PBI_EAGLEEYE_57 [Mycobacterium phage EagleEye]QDK03490.1 hypothetical protein SEA_LUCYEDI_56 [Mycobacterium phage Lucyedi]QNJ55841.1 hypothetical protein SEA_PAINTERBOY_56 [Mycobacterium phage PainterBoy]